MTRLEVWAPDGVGEVHEGDDLVALVSAAIPDLADGDVVVVTSKVVSKAEGRTSREPREDVITQETVRVVARRGPTRIVENHLGLVMAAAGVDNSNVEPGTVVLLPLDPDASARTLREGLLGATGRNVAVVVTDTAGRAWRTGQTDLAVGVAGMLPSEDHAGRTDGYGNPLAVTEPAVADEVAGAADLVTGKTAGRPVTVVRGLAERVLPAGEHGPGARSLVRPAGEDMFGLGSREAVTAVLTQQHLEAFGRAVTPADLVAGLAEVGASARVEGGDVLLDDATHHAALTAAVLLSLAHGWEPVDRHRFRPRRP